MSKRSVWMVGAMLVLGACGGGARPMITADTGTQDSGVTPGDSGTGPRDTGTTGHDSGGSSDPCSGEAAMAISLLGCNGGYVTTAPTADHDYGPCTPDADPMANPAGSCTETNAVCVADTGATMGVCRIGCPAASTYISTGTCTTGSRCFTLGTAPDEYGVCYRDCDATHMCPTGFMCDTEGSCG